MSSHSPDQIRRLAEVIAREMVAERAPGSPLQGAGAGPGGGVFSSLDDAVAASAVAFRALDALGLEKRHRIIDSMSRRTGSMLGCWATCCG